MFLLWQELQYFYMAIFTDGLPASTFWTLITAEAFIIITKSLVPTNSPRVRYPVLGLYHLLLWLFSVIWAAEIVAESVSPVDGFRVHRLSMTVQVRFPVLAVQSVSTSRILRLRCTWCRAVLLFSTSFLFIRSCCTVTVILLLSVSSLLVAV